MVRTKRNKLYRKLKRYRRNFCSSGKFGFTSKLDADIAILKRNSVIQHSKLTRSYKCTECEKWHTTSKITTLRGKGLSSHERRN